MFFSPKILFGVDSSFIYLIYLIKDFYGNYKNLKKSPLPKKNIKIQKSSKKTSDKIWEEIIHTPESYLFLELLGKEAEKEYRESKTEPGGWGD
jgi:hypothetical protein